MCNFNYDEYDEFIKKVRLLSKKKADLNINSMDYFYKTACYLGESGYKNGSFDPTYESSVLRSILGLEDKLNNRYIIEPNSIPIEAQSLQSINSSTPCENVLNSIVLEANTRLYKKIGLFHNYQKDAGKLNLADECEKAAYIVKDICDSLKIKNIVYKIEPGFMKDSNLLDGTGYHFFNIVIIGDTRFLVDLTYSQFFRENNNNIARLDVPLLTNTAPGYYMKSDTSRLSTAQTILKQFWIQATDQNLKNYFDGFALSFRNGLYYENVSTPKFMTDYRTEDYMNFLEGQDSQVNHEGEECLGKQMRPINRNK